MTDTEILKWLVEHGCIDMASLVYLRLTGDTRVILVRERIYELQPNIEIGDN